MTKNLKINKDKTATLIGANGLIGSHLLELLRNDEYYKTIQVLTRRSLSINHPKIQAIIIDFSNETAFKNAIAGSDAVFCAVGTTNKKVKGDRTAYRKVDYDIPVNAARYCAETGCPRFLTVTSVGANSTSKNFYIKLKGEVEDALSGMNIPMISIFRPSFLLGKRQEFRPGEFFGAIFIKPFSFLFPSKYRPIQAYEVARAMVAASKKDTPGVYIYHSKEMKNIQE